ncbi:MAG: hypothetical protein IJT59_04505 [Desulfovibrionaceae bacterium]|nr:hypothetical protein [Desulfovibrionaceae bacterium]
MLHRKLYLLLLLALSLTVACSRSPDDSFIDREVTGDFGTPFQIQIDNHVRRQQPAIAVQPTAPCGHRPTAVFVPLRMRQEISNATSFSNQLSRQFWNVWLSLSAFHTLEFVQTSVPYTPEMALQIARMKGAELCVGGYIDHYLDGGSGGTSTVSLSVEIYDAKRGVLVWSMAQGGMLEARQVHDFYLFSVAERNPGDPAGLIARSLAWDMGQKILKWVNPGVGRGKGQETFSFFKKSAF